MTFSEVKKKINLVGNTSVGKTSLILRYVNDMYDEKYLKTLGTNIYSKSVKTMGAEVKLIIHDIMGEKSYKSLQHNAFYLSSGAIMVADVTDKGSLEDLINYWMPRYQSIAGEDKPLYLVINKIDLEDKEITEDMITDDISVHFEDIFFTSAKTGEGVKGAFHELAISVLLMMRRGPVKDEGELEDIEIYSTKDFLGEIFNLTSRLDKYNTSVQNELLNKSDISKDILDEDIDEKRAIKFARLLENWCEDSGNVEAAAKIRDMIYQFTGKFRHKHI